MPCPRAFTVLLFAASLRAQEVTPSLTQNAGSPQPAAIVLDTTALKWDADTKELPAKPGELSVSGNFVVTNVSDREVLINKLRTSCGCTVAQLPSMPYKLAPGANVSIGVTMNLRGRSGTLAKTVTVETSSGVKSLLARTNIPPATTSTTLGVPVATPSAPIPAPVGNSVSAPVVVPGAPVSTPRVPVVVRGANATDDRAMNIQNALADRQAIFKGDCATCHVDKGVGKLGAELYAASCGICHEAEHRATMVPDLKVPRTPRDLAFWQKWITEGKPSTLMPAFAATHGGPLTQEQVDSLAAYLYQNYPRNPPTADKGPPFKTALRRTGQPQTVKVPITINHSNHSSAGNL